MKNLETICPYTGLRSFTEDESLYFKGREEQIHKVTAQLQERKFIMVTGASGDGKSSLIFAGLIPQARAGFFKSQYSSWQVADFRPERSPLKNMAMALAKSLKLDHETIEVELGRGFSSLVELYKTSSLYTDPESSTWKEATEEDRAKMDRGSANLIILIDQFEEFFTNPENFPGGVPSQDSRLLINILLETAKLSLKEDLPIYIVCTMRSDYIGQCAAFRGLPEFIGFSQFFVPRLQRKELYEVIEEPAILSGNRISKRLVERLIVDVEECTDQLPILQHALKEIWKASDSGREEMDLIHYAKVGGMDGNQLPAEFMDEFGRWKEGLPENEKNYLTSPGLNNILDIHANRLYDEAVEYCQQHGHPEVTQKKAHFIIGMAFACLTRIDENRAVRNRMTLDEITKIINVPEYTHSVVGTVLSVFRLPENTLLRPYIDEAKSREALEPESILDITHEALIRNWKRLMTWANQEFEYYNTYLDFQQQVNRWKENSKSSDFLLPIGPLTYFENWYKNCRPNPYWIYRYNTGETDSEYRLKESAQALKDGKEFLRKSSLRLLISRTFMKYGAGRIATISSVIIILTLGVLFAYIWRTRQNDYVLKDILKETEVFLGDKQLIDLDQAFYLTQVENYQPEYLNQALDNLPEKQRINYYLNFLFPILISEIEGPPPPVVKTNLIKSDSLIGDLRRKVDTSDVAATIDYLNLMEKHLRNLSYFNYFWSDPDIEALQNANALKMGTLITQVFSLHSGEDKIDFKSLQIAFTDALNFNGFSTQQRKEIINRISPMEDNPVSANKFANWFPREKGISAGVGNAVSHNGGYVFLAFLYASLGNSSTTLQCLDSLRKYNQSFDHIDELNSLNVIPYFLMYNFDDEGVHCIKEIAKKMRMEPVDLMNQALMKTGIPQLNDYLRFIRAANVNNNYTFLNKEMRYRMIEICHKLINEGQYGKDALNFNLAMLYKLSAILEDKISRFNGPGNRIRTDSIFDIALNFYNKIAPQYLDEKVEKTIQVTEFDVEKRILTRKDLFLFPGYMKAIEPALQISLLVYYSDGFFRYLLDRDLFKVLYQHENDYDLIIQWISRYFHWYGTIGNRGILRYLVYPDTFIKIDSLIAASGFRIDDAWVKMKLALDYFDKGDTANAFRKVGEIQFRGFAKTYFAEFEYFQNMVIHVAQEAARRGNVAQGMRLVGNFSNHKNRIAAYSAVAFACQTDQKFDEANVFYDSAMAEMSRLKNFQFTDDDFRLWLIKYLALRNTSESKDLSLENLGGMLWFDRDEGYYNMAYSYSQLGQYYKAWTLLPKLSSNADKSTIDGIILFHENLKNVRPEWASFFKKVEANYNFVFTENDLITR